VKGRALLIRVGALGDTIHASSAAILLKEHYPDMTIDFLASPGMAPLFSMIPEVDRVFEFPFSRIPLSIHPGWRRIGGEINSRSYTLAYLMETNPRFFPLLDRVHAEKKVRVDEWKEEEGDDQSVPVPVRCQWALSREGLVSHRVMPPGLKPSWDLDVACDKLLTLIGLDPAARIIGVHAGNSYPKRKKLRKWVKKKDLRSWPEDRWCELIRMLFHVNNGLQFVLFGSGAERAINSRIEKKVKRLNKKARLGNSAGKTDLPLAAALLRRFSLFIGTDSGPIHMAAALGIPLVGVYGPTRYEETRPFPMIPEKAAVLRASLPCQPCYGTAMQKRCRENICMEAVQVGDVVRKSLEVGGDFLEDG